MSYKELVSKLLYEIKVIKCNFFGHDLNNIGFPRKRMHLSEQNLYRDAAVAECTVL